MNTLPDTKALIVEIIGHGVLDATLRALLNERSPRLATMAFRSVDSHLEGAYEPSKRVALGIVVADMATARRLRYDVLTLIDQGLVSEAQFDHILVCDQLPASLEGLDEQALQAAFSNACFDFKSCRTISTMEAGLTAVDFSTRVIRLERSTAKTVKREVGGCWLWFEDNSHPYVRKLVQAGRVKPNKKGRYLASLDELEKGRDLPERQEAVSALSEQLREKYGVRSSYFSVRGSYSRK